MELSRRALVRCGGAALGLATTFARADTILNRQPPKSTQTAVAPPSDANKIATTNDVTHRLTVDGRLDGVGPFHFIVDTGADRTVIADDVAALLGAAPSSDVMVEGIIRTVQAPAVAVHELAVGPVTRTNLHLPVLPRAMLKTDGYLGLDVIDGFRVTFDFPNDELEIRDAGPVFVPFTRQRSQARVPVDGPSGHLRAVDCSVASVPATAFVDTGAEISIGNRSLAQALLADDPDYATHMTVPIIGTTGGLINADVVALPHVQIYDLRFGRCEIAIADLPIFDHWGLGTEPALLIGMDWLRSFRRVSIDYRQKELRFDLASVLVANRA